jgi:polyphosphate kinase
LLFPIEDGNLRERITSEILAIHLADNVKARMLQSDGSYQAAPLKRGGSVRRSQTEFIALAQGTKKASRPSRLVSRPTYQPVKIRSKSA